MAHFSQYPRLTQIAMHRAFRERTQAQSGIDEDAWLALMDGAVSDIDAQTADGGAKPYALFFDEEDIGPELRAVVADERTSAVLGEALIHPDDTIVPVLLLTRIGEEGAISPIVLADFEVMRLVTAGLQHIRDKFNVGWRPDQSFDEEMEAFAHMVRACRPPASAKEKGVTA